MIIVSVAVQFYLLYKKNAVESSHDDVAGYMDAEDIGQYENMTNSLYNTFLFTTLGDLDLNAFANTINAPATWTIFVIEIILIPTVSLNVLIAILSSS